MTLALGTTALFAAGCQCNESQRESRTSEMSRQSGQAYAQSDLSGPRGPDGPAGARGERGPAGETGPAGYAMAGPRGEAGPAGRAGPEGAAGSRGAAGEFQRGPAGERGRAGEAGARGEAGPTGERGGSGEGTAGPTGPAGPAGARGPTGGVGERGERLVGPAGAAGRAGQAGERGEAGRSGEAGAMTAGVAGEAGPAGVAGPRGETGQIGPVGPTGTIERWAFYREFWFDQDQATIHNSDEHQFEQIATYMRNNPSLELGLGGPATSGTAARRNQGMTENRVRAVRSGLVDAGVQDNRISNATIANPDHRREGRVAVMLRTKEGYVEDNNSSSDRSADRSSSDRSSSDRSSDRSSTDRSASDRSSDRSSTDRSSSDRNRSERGQGTLDDWTTYHTFSFDGDQTSIHAADRERLDEIVAFMENNPNWRLGISGSQESSDRNLTTRRSNIVRDALIDGGVDRSRVSIGEYGDSRTQRSGRIEVLVMTDRITTQAR
ncbi:MAG: hypothetical protein JJU33_01135 [Phycisphaerales bacterium]|nr:hypothetical protein [Phycisphaerales bacterium]